MQGALNHIEHPKIVSSVSHLHGPSGCREKNFLLTTLTVNTVYNIMEMVSADNGIPDLAEQPALETLHAPGRIKHRIEYRSTVTPGVAPGSEEDIDTFATEEQIVMEYVEVRITKEALDPGSATQRDPRQYHAHAKGQSYITILSPAVNEALRCIVDYYPDV